MSSRKGSALSFKAHGSGPVNLEARTSSSALSAQRELSLFMTAVENHPCGYYSFVLKIAPNHPVPVSV
jgi:hypothetical protein